MSKNQITPKKIECGSSPKSPELAKHRAMVGFEMEVLAKKVSAFGWDRDHGSPVHARVVKDWMDALQEYSLADIQAACRKWVELNPRRMPNEGDIIAILKPKPMSYAQRILAGQAR